MNNNLSAVALALYGPAQAPKLSYAKIEAVGPDIHVIKEERIDDLNLGDETRTKKFLLQHLKR